MSSAASSVAHAPQFSAGEVASLIRAHYGIEAATLSPLPGERDQNVLLQLRSGERYVLKISNPGESRELLEAQNKMLRCVAGFGCACPTPIPGLGNEELVMVAGAGGDHLVRLVSYIEGVPLAEVVHPSSQLLFDLGNLLGRVDAALEGYDDLAFHRDFHWDLVCAREVVASGTDLLEERQQEWVSVLAARFDEHVLSRADRLPKSVIHNDANDHNVLIDPDGVGIAGLIDFGDAIHSWTVGNVAVAAAYAILGKPDPLSVSAEVVRGYCSRRILKEAEVAALFGMIGMRLCISAVMAARQSRQRPGDPYLSISQAPIRETMPRLVEIPNDCATQAFRDAAGLRPTHRPVAVQFASDAFRRRAAVAGGNLRLSYSEPLHIVRGWMQYLFDSGGRRYLDAYNNVPHVGHCHPEVVEAARAQMAVLNTNTRYLSDLYNEFSERLVATMPDPLSVCYLVNSASEANELALRLARAHTGNRDVLVLEHGYHGNTTGLVDISHYKHAGPGGAGAPDWCHVAPLPDIFRGAYRDPETAGRYYAHSVGEMIEERRLTGSICAFLAESCPSVGGQILLPAGYLDSVYHMVRTAGGVCIADDVQTGYGRLGSAFYGFELQNVVPDIVVLGKPIGNGHPLAAVVTTSDIANSFDNGIEFFSTFGGNTVSCSIGLAVLDVLERENLQAHADDVGRHLLQNLEELQSKYPLVGDVRGSGFFIGVELTGDPATREPAPAEAESVVNRLKNRRVLIGTEGAAHNVLKIRPPMPFTIENADFLTEQIAEVLEELSPWTQSICPS